MDHLTNQDLLDIIIYQSGVTIWEKDNQHSQLVIKNIASELKRRLYNKSRLKLELYKAQAKAYKAKAKKNMQNPKGGLK